MRRFFGLIAMVVAGCSTAPVADVLDAVAPGAHGSQRQERADSSLPPLPRHGPDGIPRRLPRDEDVPPLPPVPSGFRMPDPDDEGERPVSRSPGAIR